MDNNNNQINFLVNIPKNIMDTGRLLKIPYQNWIEAILVTLLIGYVIYSIPFVLKIQIILFIILGISSFVFFLRGIQNKSVFQFMVNVFRYRSSRAEYHLGSVNDERKQNNQNEFGNQSYAERTIKKGKQLLHQFDEKYGQE